MGYSHGNKWDDASIESAILDVMKKAKISTMPSHSLIDEVTGSSALTNAIAKHGGTKSWAVRMGLEVKQCESELGYLMETECAEYIINTLNLDCEKTQIRYPYDLIADGNIKIDVKCANPYYSKNGKYYAFNLEKKNPTCDVFVCYCIEDGNVQKTYVIPSCLVSGKTQLSIGYAKSKYDRFIDKWDVILEYSKFYNNISKMYKVKM